MKTVQTFEASLVKLGELRSSNSGTEYMFLTLARNYNEKQGNDWVSTGELFINATAFGAVARSLAHSNIPLGTTLLVTGTLQGRKREAYTDKQGVEHPARFEEGLLIDAVGVSLSRNQAVSTSRIGKDGVAQQQAPQRVAQATPSRPQPVNTIQQSVVSGFDSFTSLDDDDEYDDIFND